MNFPTDRFENVQQVGGITTATLDNGPGRGCRVANVNTGGGLRYTVALDRAPTVDANGPGSVPSEYGPYRAFE